MVSFQHAHSTSTVTSEGFCLTQAVAATAVPQLLYTLQLHDSNAVRNSAAETLHVEHSD
jgi:hypothetical protein